MPVERDLALAAVDETWQQVDQRCLARARGAHQRHDLARCHTQADVVERWRLFCAERDADLIQHNLPPHPVGSVCTFRLCPGVTQ